MSMPVDGSDTSRRYCGRDFSEDEIDAVRKLIERNPEFSRRRLSIEVCRVLNWVRINGALKDMSCRVALLRMEKNGLITLPPPRIKISAPHRKPVVEITSRSDPGLPITAPAGKLGRIEAAVVSSARDSRLYAELIARYHYLGYTPLAGAQLRYLAYCPLGLVAVLGFAASAWKCAPRDSWIGWNADQREQRLHLAVNNARFLIPPWVRSPNLASKILGLIARRIRTDWISAYSYAPVLLETFVEKPRPGTCYRAANWRYLGDTKGRGKLGGNKPTLPIKAVFAYPLVPSWRTVLTANNDR